MTETVKIVSKLFFLSAVTLFGFTSILNNVGQKLSQPEQRTDLESENWNMTSYPESGSLAESDQIPELASEVPNLEDLEEFRKIMEEQQRIRLHQPEKRHTNTVNDTVVDQYPITTSKITSPHCGSFLCIPHAPNDISIRPKIAVII